ncbi:hypothetical protein HK101_010387 [Irineochytrium annulatum]|nr:hypothetical protein HK101_010387 [Irineochytrium annulatum]
MNDVEVAIPSTDGVQLQARVHKGRNNAHICVILTHPYGRLGGSLDNNVVERCTAYFAQEGLMTIRFNFRGVGRSTGWGTFRGIGELDDVVSVYKWAKLQQGGAPRNFIICGYSFGSVVAAAAACEMPECIGIISISYPYSVLWSLTLFNGQQFTDALELGLRTTPRCFVFGDSDNFTAVKDFQAFYDKLPQKKDLYLAPQCDHFWHGRENEVVGRIAKWMKDRDVIATAV